MIMVRPAEPVASVIIPTYNRAHLVTRSIESVLRQTFKKYEIIVIDDGSRDNTGEMLRERYGKQIVYIGKDKNQGLSAARNTGIVVARGKYLALLDDDDEWLPEKLELQISRMEADASLGIVYCNGCTINEKDELIGEIRGFARGAILNSVLSYNCVGPPSGVLIRKDVLAQTGYFDEKLCALEDWDLWIRVAQLYAVDFVDRCLVNYRVHADNMSKNVKVMRNATFTVLDKYRPLLGGENGNESRRNAVYSSHCVNFAWKEYTAGDMAAFTELMVRALEHDASRVVFAYGWDIRKKEQALFETFRVFWASRNPVLDGSTQKNSYAAHYLHFAWEYYHQGAMADFRRCLIRVFQYTFPKLHLRLALPFMKSYLGKSVSDAMHRVRVLLGRRLSRYTMSAYRCLDPTLQMLRTRAGRGKSLLMRRKAIRSYLHVHQVRKLHLGCGHAVLHGWLNTDLEPGRERVYVDVGKRLPFDDDTFDYVFSEHLIEHLTYREGADFLRECFRILKPGGTIRVATPDLAFLIGLYSPGKNLLQQRYVTWAAETFLPNAAACQDVRVINNFFHNWGHRFIYDFKTIEDSLKKVGFVTLRRRNVGESDDPELNGVESHHLVIPEEYNRLETMVVEALKPGTGV